MQVFLYSVKYCVTTNDKFAEILERKLSGKKEFIEIEIVENELERFPCYDLKNNKSSDLQYFSFLFQI